MVTVSPWCSRRAIGMSVASVIASASSAPAADRAR